MSFNSFREWLETDYLSPITSKPLGHDAPSDYASRLRTLSRLIETDIENSDVAALEAMASSFAADDRIASTQTRKAIIDMRVALRRYAMFRRLRAAVLPPTSPDNPGRADRLAAQLRILGFEMSRQRRHTFELRKGDFVLYVKRLSDTLPIVIGPEFDTHYSRLATLPGITGPNPFSYYHNSQMPAFPRRMHGGQTPIHYGIAFDVRGPAALDRFVSSLLTRKDLAPSKAERAEQNTETVRLQKARLGQGQFRADLVDIWGACPLSGVSTPELLRASHIKPWRVSSQAERLDPHNGILLTVPLDCLFDSGFISFTDEGEMLISDRLTSEERKTFALLEKPQAVTFRAAHLPYLLYHRTTVYLEKGEA